MVFRVSPYTRWSWEASLGWVFAALASATVFAAVSVLDKRILAVYAPGVLGFYNIVGFIQLGMAATAAVLVPWQGAPSYALISAIASGALWGLVLIALFYALRILEVSRVIPFYNTFPVFVAVMSVAFLGEHLTIVHWLAILVVVTGAGLSTIGQSEKKDGNSGIKLAFLALVLASLFTAAGTVTSKVALEEMEFWNVFALRSIFLGLVLLVPGLMKEGRRQVSVILADKRGLSLILLTEAMLAPVGLFTMLLALTLGPASLVATLLSTRPVFVLGISVLLSIRFIHLLDEPLTRDVLALKALSAILVAAGVSALSLA